MGVLAGGHAAFAQDIGASYDADALTSQRQPVRIIIRPMYQHFDSGDQGITEWSMPIQATVPIRNNVQLSLRGSVASVGGDALEGVSGLSDVQASLSYVRQLGEGSVILSTGVNAPTGKQKLTLAEFETAALLSQNFFDFQVPSFGQGLGLATGATWAIPVGEDVVVGLGGSFRYHNGYTPVESMADTYNPGSEVLATVGLDYRLNRMSALSGDVSLTLYGTDRLGEVERFEAGNRFASTLQYRRDRGYSTLRLVARYEGQQKSTLPAIGLGDTQELQLLPSEGTLRGAFTTRLTDAIDLTLWTVGRLFGETETFDAQTLFRVGVAPAFSASANVVLMPRVAATFGDLTGFQAGLTVQAQR